MFGHFEYGQTKVIENAESARTTPFRYQAYLDGGETPRRRTRQNAKLVTNAKTLFTPLKRLIGPQI